MKCRKLQVTSILFLLLQCTATVAQNDSVYLVAGALIDTLAGKRIADPVVEIRDDRIVSVTSGGTVPAGAKNN